MCLPSISNSKLTLLRKLNQKKYRRREQLFFVEGKRAVRQIIENEAVSVDSLFFDESKTVWNSRFWSIQVDRVAAYSVPQSDFLEVCDTDHPQGILAVCEMPAETNSEKLAEEEGIILAADQIQDPGNLGTMVRTAAWFGASGLLVGKGTVDFFHPKVVRSTAGAVGTVPFIFTDLNDGLTDFEKEGWRVTLLNISDRSEDIKRTVHSGKIIVVVGNEANGIDDSLNIPGRSSVHISARNSNNSVESLNAAVTTAIALYEFS